MSDYEEILTAVTALPNALGGESRDILWLTDAAVIGVTRDEFGHLEIFLRGPGLQPLSPLLRQAIHYHDWHRTGAAPLGANRLLFPAMGHFDSVGAFICTELLRSGADTDIERAFRTTEPLIELTLRRLQLSEAAMLGLIGELLLLKALCPLVGDAQLAQIVEQWQGWRRSARDFVWRGTGVEVKTTTRPTSSHLVEGLHQVEPSDGVDGGDVEHGLLLVSVGLKAWTPGQDQFTIPSLVTDVVDHLKEGRDPGAIHVFLEHVSAYGSESGFGYRHHSMSRDAPFARPFALNFVRAYDLADPDIRVLRRRDLVDHQHVEEASVRFQVNLPTTITARNPVTGLDAVAHAILSPGIG